MISSYMMLGWGDEVVIMGVSSGKAYATVNMSVTKDSVENIESEE